jgi:hypothetical protein
MVTLRVEGVQFVGTVKGDGEDMLTGFNEYFGSHGVLSCAVAD